MNKRCVRQMTLEIGPMSIDDLRLTLAWAAAEGWNPGIEDAEAFLVADPEGFLIGRIDGVPAVSISAVAYGADFGFIGLYICRAEYRGHGHGAALARTALARLEGRVVGLDGVVDRIDSYARLGFEAAHHSFRYGGEIAPEWPGDPRLVAVTDDSAAGVLGAAIAAVDRACFGAERPAFLSRWITPTATRNAVAVIGEDGNVTGYGVIRACGEGSKIGPLFAASAEDAESLLVALAATRPGLVFLDVPEPNAAGLDLAARYGMTRRFETVRMYRNGRLDLPLERIFGLTSFELG